MATELLSCRVICGESRAALEHHFDDDFADVLLATFIS